MTTKQSPLERIIVDLLNNRIQKKRLSGGLALSRRPGAKQITLSRKEAPVSAKETAVIARYLTPHIYFATMVIPDRDETIDVNGELHYIRRITWS